MANDIKAVVHIVPSIHTNTDNETKIAEYSNNGNSVSNLNVYTQVDLEPGEKMIVIKKSNKPFLEYPNNVSSLFGYDDNIKKIENSVVFDTVRPELYGSESYNAISDTKVDSATHLITSNKEWVSMIKRQLHFLFTSLVFILVALIGFIVTILTKNDLVYPTIYPLLFIMGLGWMITSVFGIHDILKNKTKD